MKNAHLFWIIPLCLALGYLLGLYLNIPHNIDVTLHYNETLAREAVEAINNFNCSRLG